MKWWIVAFLINVQGDYGHIEYKGREFETMYSCKSFFKTNSKNIMIGLQSKLNQDPDETIIQHNACLPTEKHKELNKKTRNKNDSI